MSPEEAIFASKIPVRLTLDDIIAITSALAVIQRDFRDLGDEEQAAHYEQIIKTLEQASHPALVIMGAM